MKKWILPVLVILFALPSSFAFKYIPTHQNSCKDLDFRTLFPMKIRNQGELGWCYAHAAADYLQFTYQLPVQLSAADIAINYSKSSWSKFVTLMSHIFSKETRGQPPQTGIIKGAVSRILSQGYCAEEALPSDFWTKVDTKTGEKTQEEILQSIFDSQSLQKMILAGNYTSGDQLPYYFEFKHVNQNQFFDLLQNSSASTFLLHLRNLACAGERKPFPGTIALNFQIRTNHVFQNMNASFDRGMPVTMDFFDTILTDYDQVQRSPSSLHTVLLYGRKYDPENEECSYLIKNSHGESCTAYDPKIPCDHGYLWLPESKLFPVMTSQLIIKR